MKKGVQRVMHCPCGHGKILAQGLCATCYTLKRQDEEYFGGPREAVLERDGHCRRVCGASGSRQALDHRASSRTRQIRSRSDDFALPGLRCQSASNENGTDATAALASGAVARAAPAWSGADRFELQSAEAGRSSGAAGL